MKAAFLDGIRDIKVREAPTPKVRADTALIKVKACGVCGSDLKFFNYGDRVKKFPQILGHEVSGQLVDVGKNVNFLREGDRVAIANEIPCKNCYVCMRGLENVCENISGVVGVTIPGGFAEYMFLNEDMLSKGPINMMPKNITFDEGSLAEPLGCVVNGLEFARMEEGKDVLVIGTGPIGCLIINLAKILGASKIVAVDKSQKRLDMAQPFGADHYIHSENNNFLDDVLSLTNGKGYDIVMTACGDVKAQEKSICAAAKGGFVNLFGGVAKGLPDMVSFSNKIIHYRQFAIGGSFSQTKEHHRKALEYIASGKIKTEKIITHRFKLEDTEKAIMTVQNCEGLKVIVNP